MGAIQATISLYSLQAFLLETGREDLFSGLVFPDGIDKELACDVIMSKSMQFELVYTNPAFLRPMITTWGKKWFRTFSKWYEGVMMNYDPIYNYDRYEEWTDDKDTNGTRTDNLKQTNNLTKTDDLTRTDDLTQTDSTTETGEVAAYETGTLYTHDKTTNGGNIKNTGNVKNTGTVKDTGDVTNTGTQKNEETEKGKHSGHIYGNIGVNTSSQILKEYLDQQAWNLYEHIADVFIEEFCIMVY